MKHLIIESEDGSQRRAWLRDDGADAILFLVGKMTQELDSLPAIPDARELITRLADALRSLDKGNYPAHWEPLLEEAERVRARPGIETRTGGGER